MGPFRRRRAVISASVLCVLLIACAACSSAGHPARRDALLPLGVPDRVVVTTRALPGLGTVLVDGRGRTLYMFPPDAGDQVKCTGACAGTWPPLVIEDGRTPSAAGQANREDLSTLADPNTGQRIITYAGYPLYRYAGDVHAGSANGQALFLNGGPWYVMNTGG